MKSSDYRKMQNPLSHCAVIIGIDPGVETGVAIGSAEDPTIPIRFFTMDFWQTYEAIKLYNRGRTGIVIEAPKKTRLYDRQDAEQGYRRREKIAANAGGNAREAELLADGLERLGFPVVRVTPTRTKWTAAELVRHTGITQRTNQHVRDAIRMVWDRVR